MPRHRGRRGARSGPNLHREPALTSTTASAPENKIEKIYFKLLQAIHHVEIIENSHKTGKYPKGMMRQVNKFISFIKPSSSCDETREKVRQNTLNILKEHYDPINAGILQSLPPCDPLALQKAVVFGRTRHRHKLTSSSISTLSSLIKTKTSDPNPKQPGSNHLPSANPNLNHPPDLGAARNRLTWKQQTWRNRMWCQKPLQEKKQSVYLRPWTSRILFIAQCSTWEAWTTLSKTIMRIRHPQ